MRKHTELFAIVTRMITERFVNNRVSYATKNERRTSAVVKYFDKIQIRIL